MRPFRIFYRVEKTIRELARGARVQIVSLGTEGTLAERLRALGLGEGARIVLLQVSARKRVYYVRTGSTVVALGAETAGMIGVRA